MKLNYQQALKQIKKNHPVWIIHGDEPLLQQNILTALRQHWQQQGIERQRIDVVDMESWKTIFYELANTSLFAQQVAIEVHGNIKPDKAILQHFQHLFAHPSENILVMIFPKQDQTHLKSAFFQLIETHAISVNLTLYTTQDQHQILKIEADQLGLTLDSEAWQVLLSQHENNLLAARNTLIQLAHRLEQSQVTVHDIIQQQSDQSRFSTFDLGDACLIGNLTQATKILNFLIEAGEAQTLIFWVLQKDMRILLTLFEDPYSIPQGVFKNKLPLYQQALKRIHHKQWMTWSALLLHTDAAIKGVSMPLSSQEYLQQLVYQLCGQYTVSNVSDF